MLPKPFPFATLPQIKTNRLILKPLAKQHLEAYHQLCAEEKTMRYYGLKHHTTIEDTQKTLHILDSWFQAHTALRWGVFYHCGELIGDIGFWQFDVLRNRAETSAKISMRCQERGIGSEALTAVVNFGFSTLKLNGIDGNIATENKASIALANKLGFREIGIRPQLSYSTFTQSWQDMVLFSLNRQDWKNHE